MGESKKAFHRGGVNKHLELAGVRVRVGCWTGRREFPARRAVGPRGPRLGPTVWFEELGEQIWKLEDQVGRGKATR